MKSTQFKRTPDGMKTKRMLEVEERIGAKLEDDYRANYLEGSWGQKRLAKHWGVQRSQIFGHPGGRRRNWVQMLKLPVKGQDASPKKQSRVASRLCEICTIDDTPLEAAHWIPAREGGTSRVDNILKLCPNCHRKLDLLRNPMTIKRAQQTLLLRAAETFLRSTTSRDEAVQVRFLALCSRIIERR